MPLQAADIPPTFQAAQIPDREGISQESQKLAARLE